MRSGYPKWGNSLAVRIPQGIAKQAHISEGDRLALGLKRRRQHRPSLHPAAIWVVRACQPDYSKKPSWGDRLGAASWEGILVKTGYVPETGDFVWLTFDPQAGPRAGWTTPALVLSPGIYNARSGLALVCPVTNQRKGYPFEVAVPGACGVSGVILADHMKSIHWKARLAEKLADCPRDTIDEVRARLAPLLGY